MRIKTQNMSAPVASALALVCVLGASDVRGAFGDLYAASDSNASNSSGSVFGLQTEMKDPAGFYKPFSDPSITQAPAKEMKIGNGQLVSISYDGSKGGPSVFYQLSYVDPDGNVRPMTGGPFDSKGNGVFSHEIKVFTSAANDRPGFMEVSTIKGVGMSGRPVKLGTYAVIFEVSK